jgi:ankyrin repeat protein
LVTYRDGYGITPLHGAAFMGFQDMVELLLTNNADVNAKDVKGETPLQAAKMAKHQNIVELLLKHGGPE